MTIGSELGSTLIFLAQFWIDSSNSRCVCCCCGMMTLLLARFFSQFDDDHTRWMYYLRMENRDEFWCGMLERNLMHNGVVLIECKCLCVFQIYLYCKFIRFMKKKTRQNANDKKKRITKILTQNMVFFSIKMTIPQF